MNSKNCMYNTTMQKRCLLDRCIGAKGRANGPAAGNGLAAVNYSCICIPRLDANVTEDYVRDIIHRLNWGEILKLSVVLNKKNAMSPFISIFIDIVWNDSPNIERIRKIIGSGQSIKIVHNHFNVWKIYEKKNNVQLYKS